MKFIPIIVFFATSTVFASDMDTIHLSKAKNFNVNNCKVINSARIAISSKVSEFKINTDDYHAVLCIIRVFGELPGRHHAGKTRTRRLPFRSLYRTSETDA